MASRMKLIDGECILNQFGAGGAVTLTTHRVMDESRFDVTGITSIMLEDLTSCRVVYSENILWAVLGAIVLLVGVGASFSIQSPAPAVAGSILAVILFTAFRGSKKQQLTLASGADAMNIQICCAGISKSTDFIHAVQSAKNQRYMLLTHPEQVSRLETQVAAAMATGKL